MRNNRENEKLLVGELMEFLRKNSQLQVVSAKIYDIFGALNKSDSNIVLEHVFSLSMSHSGNILPSRQTMPTVVGYCMQYIQVVD